MKPTFSQQQKFIALIGEAAYILGGKSDLLSLIGSFGDTMPAEDMIDGVKEWIYDAKKERGIEDVPSEYTDKDGFKCFFPSKIKWKETEYGSGNIVGNYYIGFYGGKEEFKFLPGRGLYRLFNNSEEDANYSPVELWKADKFCNKMFL